MRKGELKSWESEKFDEKMRNLMRKVRNLVRNEKFDEKSEKCDEKSENYYEKLENYRTSENYTQDVNCDKEREIYGKSEKYDEK